MGAPKSELRAFPTTAPSEPTSPQAQDGDVDAVLTGVIAGERWAHAALYDLLLPVVARTLQKILRDSSGDYEDLVQVSFERIVRTITAAKGGQVLSLSAWAGSIAAHVALDALRRRTRERRIFERESAGRSVADNVPAPSLERQLEARRRLEGLHDVLSRMNKAQAQTLLLHDVLGHGLSEIASIMGVTVAAAQRRLSRGRRELLRRGAALGLREGK